MAIIMISRGTFSGGKAVAEGLAGRLNYPCISNEIIFDAAEAYGVPEERLTAVLQEPPKIWRQRPGRRLAHMNFVRTALLKKVVNDNLVYYGYAGHLLLTGISHVIRVRIIADMEYRLKAAMTQEGLNRPAAKEMIDTLDRKSEKWTQTLYGIQWSDPALYDVVLNLDGMRIEAAVDIVGRMTELDDFKPTPESRRAFKDQMLSSMVWAALTRDSMTKKANVRVLAEGGNVTITGKASSHKIVGVIPHVAGQVEGVKAIKNEVGVGTDWVW
jgi:cytidylate kinase